MGTRSRRIVLTAAFTAVALALSGCVFQSGGGGGTPAPTSAEVTGPLEIVSFYPQGTAEWNRLQGLADEFAADHEGVVPKLTFGGGQDVPAIEARWRSGTPPEVNVGFFSLADADGGDWVAAGDVEDLTTAMGEQAIGYDSSWKDSMLPGVADLVTLKDGKIYAVPSSVTTIQFFYNKKIFDDHGIEVPKTLDELLAAADRLRDAGVAPFTVTGTFLPYMQMYWDYLALRYIGYDGLKSAIDGDAELATLPGAAEAAAALEKVTAEGNFTAGFRGTDFTAAQMNFFQGKAAMILMGSWLQGEMADAIPADFELGTFAFPTVEGGHGAADGLFGTINTYTIAAHSPNPSAGVEFVRFVSSKDNQEAMVESTKSISGFRGVKAPAGFEDVTAQLEKGAAFSPSFMDILSQSQEVQNAYNQPIARLFFGEIDGATMLQQMSDGLAAAAKK